MQQYFSRNFHADAKNSAWGKYVVAGCLAVDGSPRLSQNGRMRFSLSYLSDLLEDRPDWVVATAGVITAMVVYALFRGLVWFWRALIGAPSKPHKKRAFLPFRLGALFFRTSDECIDMNALSNTPDSETVAGDKRSNFRRRDKVVEIMLAVAPGAEPRRAWVVDRSTTGLGILVKVAVETGTVIGVRPMDAPPSVPWVDVEVRSCAAQGKHFRLGCKFLETPAWGVLLMFG